MGARSQKAVTRPGVSVRIASAAEGTTGRIVNRDGADHGSAPGVGRADGSEQGKGKRQASAPRRPSGAAPGRRGGTDGSDPDRAGGGVAGSLGDSSGELRRRGARSACPGPTAGRSVRRRVVGQGE